MKIYERSMQALLSPAPRGSAARSRVLARLALLAQIGELARRLRLLVRWLFGDWISRIYESSRREDEHYPPHHGRYTNSSSLESDVKVTKCHAMLFFDNPYEPKMDVILTIKTLQGVCRQN